MARGSTDRSTVPTQTCGSSRGSKLSPLGHSLQSSVLILTCLGSVLGPSRKWYGVNWDLLDRDPVSPVFTSILMSGYTNAILLFDDSTTLDYLITSLYAPQPVEALPFDAFDFWIVLTRLQQFGIKPHCFEAISREFHRLTQLHLCNGSRLIWADSKAYLALNSFIFHHTYYTQDPVAKQAALRAARRLIMCGGTHFHQDRSYVNFVLWLTRGIAPRVTHPLRKAMKTFEAARTNVAGDIPVFTRRECQQGTPRWTVPATRPSKRLCLVSAGGSITTHSPPSSPVQDAHAPRAAQSAPGWASVLWSALTWSQPAST